MEDDTMNKNDKTAEEKIDREIAQRTPEIHVCHIMDDITDISYNINGITIVSDTKIYYNVLIKLINDKTDDLDSHAGGIFPGDIKECLIDNGYTGVAICDHRDQYSRQEGRTRAKRSWLRTHPYTHPRVKKFRELRKV